MHTVVVRRTGFLDFRQTIRVPVDDVVQVHVTFVSGGVEAVEDTPERGAAIQRTALLRVVHLDPVNVAIRYEDSIIATTPATVRLPAIGAELTVGTATLCLNLDSEGVPLVRLRVGELDALRDADLCGAEAKATDPLARAITLTHLPLWPADGSISVGSMFQLVVEVHGDVEPSEDNPVRWTSSNPDVLGVESSGADGRFAYVELFGNAEGTSFVTPRFFGASFSRQLTVEEGLAHVEVGTFAACAVTTRGTAYCWGFNETGQLGDASLHVGDTAASIGAPRLIPGGIRYRKVEPSSGLSCGLATTGLVYCWGTSWERPTSPKPISTTLRFDSLTVGGGFACGIAIGGKAYCWGDNSLGQLGNGGRESRFLDPVPVLEDRRFMQLSAGSSHACGVALERAISKIFCWGSHRSQLGILTRESCTTRPDRHSPFESPKVVPCSTTPVPLETDQTFSHIAAGGKHDCAIEATTGAAYCWGDNDDGELGIGKRGGGAQRPVAVHTDERFMFLSAYGGTTCGIAANPSSLFHRGAGQVWCWGDGPLGNGKKEGSPTPVRIPGPVAFEVRTISLGFFMTCAVNYRSQGYCWGPLALGSRGGLREYLRPSWFKLPKSP